MKPILIILHICVCVALIMIVLLQKGKGASLGAAFGGGASQTVFGSAGSSSFMRKITTIVAIVFMLTCLGLSFFFGKGTSSSIMEGVSQTEEAPAQVPAADTSAGPTQGGQTQGGETQKTPQ